MTAMILTVIIVAAVAFFGGMKYQQSKTGSSTGTLGQGNGFGQGGRPGGQRGAGGRGFGGATVGEVISQDDKSITLKLQDGSSKLVNIAKSTIYSKTDTATMTDVKVGERVAAIGSTNSDGSITAQNIQLNPMFRNGRGPGGGQQPSLGR